MSGKPVRLLELSCAILEHGCHLRCSTVGSSMFPLFRTGSIIEVEPAAAATLRPGDAILYRRGTDLVGHRLVERGWEQDRLVLLTRGDSFHRSAVEKVEPEQVLGRIISVELRPGLTLRIDSGLGRLLGLILARGGFLRVWAYLSLRKVKGQWPRWFPWVPGGKPQEGLTPPVGTG